MRRILPTLGLGILGLTACSPDESQESVDTVTAPLSTTAHPYFVVLDGPGASQALPEGLDRRSAAAGAITKARIKGIEAEQAAIEPLLVAEGATVIARITRLANVVQVQVDEAGAQRIARLPGVRRVELVPLLERSLASAVRVVGAPEVWTGLSGITGDGITIGIVDSGIDYTHADFGGPGTVEAYEGNDSTILEPGTFPTAKVVGGWDFAGDGYDASGTQGSTGPVPDPDPLDCATTFGEQISGGHGTHVSGIAAGSGVLADGSAYSGPYDVSLDLNSFRVAPGVAPRAKLFGLKIFGCEGSTGLLASALDRAVDPNDDGQFDDRLDVVNGSLGTSYALGTPTIGEMVTELTEAGTLVVAAAGNDRQNFYAVGSPATYSEVLSVAGTADNEFHNLRVTTASGELELPAAESMFSARLLSVGAVTAPIVRTDPVLGCAAFANAAEVAGKIALIDRGSCPFVDKAANAQAAGAVAVIIIDDDDSALPFAMSGDPGSSAIPAFLVTLDDGAELLAALAQGPATGALSPTDRYTGPGAELLAGFSSRGPSPIDGRLKPEIAAPGIVDSALAGSGSSAVSNGGTSMASPMVAGAAALVREAQPDLGPMEVKAVLMNASVPLADLAGVTYGTGVVGAGRFDVRRAVELRTTAATDLASGEIGVSFGSIAATSSTEVDRTFVVTNHGDAAATYDVSVAPTYELEGATLTAAPASITLDPGASTTVTLTLTLDPVAFGSPGPDPGTPAMQGNQEPEPRHYLNQTSGVVRLQSEDGAELALPYTGAVRAASSSTGSFTSSCEDDPATATIELADEGAHPAHAVTVMNLVGVDDPRSDAETDPQRAQSDLLALGVATDRATVPAAEAKIYFGFVMNGPWTTPARGPLSLVKVQVNTDEDSSYDFEIRTEARNPDGPFRDALIATTYDLASGERLGRFPVNIVRPDVAATYPFNSSVLVLSASLAEIGLDGDDMTIRMRAATERPDSLTNGDNLGVEIDLANLPIDAAPHGREGLPIFLGADSIVVDVAPGAGTVASPADVLLLHHTNPPGQQWEVVRIARDTSGALSISSSGPETVEVGETADVTITVTNGSAGPASNVTITGTAAGGELVSATTAQGSCAGVATLSCELGELAPGASVAIQASVRSLDSSAEITVEAAVSSDLACNATPEDDATTLTIELIESPEDEIVEPRGGCGCMTHQPKGSSAWVAALAILGAALRRRRR